MALFIQIPMEVVSDPSVSHAAKLVYGRLLLYRGRDGRCNPAHHTLAAEVCIRRRQVKNVLDELKARGWITWTRTRNSCFYTICGPVPDRQKIAHLDNPDRQEIAPQIGNKLPIKIGKKLPIKRCIRKEVLKISSSSDEPLKWKPEEVERARASLGKHRGRGDQPDDEITLKVLGWFDTIKEFHEWMEDLAGRLKPDRITGNYGVYATDAERYMASKRAKQAEEQQKRLEHERTCSGVTFTAYRTNFDPDHEYSVLQGYACHCSKGKDLDDAAVKEATQRAAELRGGDWVTQEQESRLSLDYSQRQQQKFRAAHPERAAEFAKWDAELAAFLNRKDVA
jgi:hypothetical protein